MSTSMSISQFLALQISAVQVSGALDRDPDLAVGAAVGVAVGDARSSGTRPGRSRASSGQ